MRVVWILINPWFHASILIQKILKGSFQTKLKGASVWTFKAFSKVAAGCLS